MAVLWVKMLLSVPVFMLALKSVLFLRTDEKKRSQSALLWYNVKTAFMRVVSNGYFALPVDKSIFNFTKLVPSNVYAVSRYN